MNRVTAWIRGRYTHGPFNVTAKRWWSPTDRKASQLAVKVLAHEWAKPASPTEMRGLRNIVESTGPSGGISEPPARALYKSDEDYDAAYSEWYARVTYWRAA